MAPGPQVTSPTISPSRESEIRSPLDARCVNTIRCIGAALPQQAKSGHPGAPMGCAPIAHVLWSYVMNYAPQDPQWWNRDRFVLSNGHASSLLYTMLHLAGYNVTTDDLKAFRQLSSITPGHPENIATPGVEVTTGPLGQGLSQAVGLALASHHLGCKYNRPHLPPLFDNFTYVLCGDGCLQEGVTSEASSLAGHWNLGRLICLYDSNLITIDGSTELSFTEDVMKRYEAYGWHVQAVDNGDTGLMSIYTAIDAAQKITDKPSLIVVNTNIAYGSSKQGSAKTHGAPLGVDDILDARRRFGLNTENIWHIDQEVINFYNERVQEASKKYLNWRNVISSYQQTYPAEWTELKRRFAGELPESYENAFPLYDSNDTSATRVTSHKVLNSLAPIMPEIIGGSADLTESNKTDIKGVLDLTRDNYANRYIRFGVREHGMCAILNGLSAYGGMRPFGATFLNFMTYAWGAVRLSALSHFGILYIATHDSIELGEDGPTHQPIELLALLRATPNLLEFRPADGRETNAGYAVFLKNKTRPTVLCLSRANTPTLEGSCQDKAQKGAYVVQDFLQGSNLKKVLIGASGTEVALCLEAKRVLEENQKATVRVVSMPSWTLFNEQSEQYRAEVLCKSEPNVTMIYVEAANALGAEQYGFTIKKSMSTFGASAPKNVLYQHYGFTPKDIVALLP